jgi:hypothetical protein
LLMNGIFGVNKNAASMDQPLPRILTARLLTIVIIPDKTILGGKSFEDV